MLASATRSSHSRSFLGKHWLTALAFVLFLLLSATSHASEIDLLKYELRDLQSDNVALLNQYRGKTAVIIFFEPDCPFCFKQTKILNDLQHECTDFQAIGVGVNGSRHDLQKEVRHLDPKFPAFQINSELQRDVGKVEGTPMMLVANKDGTYSSHLRGYQKLDNLLPALTNAGLECI